MKRTSKRSFRLAYGAIVISCCVGALVWQHYTRWAKDTSLGPQPAGAAPRPLTAAPQERFEIAARMADVEPAPTGELLAIIAKTGHGDLVREAAVLQDLRAKYASDLAAFEESQAALATAGREGRGLGERELERVHNSGDAIMETVAARQREIFERSSTLIAHYAEIRARQLGID